MPLARVNGLPSTNTARTACIATRAAGSLMVVRSPRRITSYNVCYTKLLRVLSSLLAVTQQQGDTLHGKRVGIIGAGNTGSAVGSHLSALGCEILWCDPPLEQQGDPRTFVSLEQALQADIVSLHVPLTRTGERNNFV